MTEHLPECKWHEFQCWCCICYEIRVCEQRVLDAAREAVAALPEYRMRDTCIAAIEQLREEKK